MRNPYILIGQKLLEHPDCCYAPGYYCKVCPFSGGFCSATDPRIIKRYLEDNNRPHIDFSHLPELERLR